MSQRSSGGWGRTSTTIPLHDLKAPCPLRRSFRLLTGCLIRVPSIARGEMSDLVACCPSLKRSEGPGKSIAHRRVPPDAPSPLVLHVETPAREFLGIRDNVLEQRSKPQNSLGRRTDLDATTYRCARVCRQSIEFCYTMEVFPVSVLVRFRTRFAGCGIRPRELP